MEFSEFGRFFSADSGIFRLMDDIDAALSSPGQMHLLGGGNPAHIPEVQEAFRNAMHRILADGKHFERMIGNYDGCQGNTEFIAALADLLQHKFGWDVGPANIAVTNGSQSSFFVLFNLFAGRFSDGGYRKVLLPLTPEYIGYGGAGLGQPLFTALRPAIECRNDHEFKYRVDFEGLVIGPEVGALAMSRPTNPTGNVLTDEEIAQLRALAAANDLPFILDAAYGSPFPNIVFAEATPTWDQNTIFCLSLSKLGLPGLRTGIVVANESVVRAVAGSNAILSLAPGSAGPVLVTEMLRDGSMLQISDRLIRPYYERRAKEAVGWLESALGDYPWRVHTPEGAIFLWLWFEDLPISSETLYQRLKQRGVLVISGEHFFPGLEDDWEHRHQCIRISYGQDPATVQAGIEIIAEEIRGAYGSAAAKIA
jgi:valine--pyruvate aminotransferase